MENHQATYDPLVANFINQFDYSDFEKSLFIVEEDVSGGGEGA